MPSKIARRLGHSQPCQQLISYIAASRDGNTSTLASFTALNG